MRRAQGGLQKERDRLKLLLELTNRAVSNLELRDLLRDISASIRQVMRCDAVGVMLPDSDSNQLRLYDKTVQTAKDSSRRRWEFRSRDRSPARHSKRANPSWQVHSTWPGWIRRFSTPPLERAYAYAILAAGWLIWMAQFLLAKRNHEKPKVDRRARWGVLLVAVAYTILWQNMSWPSKWSVKAHRGANAPNATDICIRCRSDVSCGAVSE